MNSSALEATYKDMERKLKHLWEAISITVQACDYCRKKLKSGENNQPIGFRVPHIRSSSTKVLARSDSFNWLMNVSRHDAYVWCLIVAVSQFDAWIEDVVNRLHEAHEDLRSAAKRRRYRSDTPSFSRAFFADDQAALGLSFGSHAGLLDDFIKVKETRNLLVHQAGRVTQRYIDTCDPAAVKNKKINLDAAYVQAALATTLEMATQVRRQLRRLVRKRLRASKTRGPAMRRVPSQVGDQLLTRCTRGTRA